jgi:hypothetical protein
MVDGPTKSRCPVPPAHRDRSVRLLTIAFTWLEARRRFLRQASRSVGWALCGSRWRSW